MKYGILGISAFMIGMSAASPAIANVTARTDGQSASSPFMRVYGRALPPVGYVGFCQRNPAECREKAGLPERISLSGERRGELTHINDMVNEMIRPATDQELYGRVEHWTFPDGQGDCEDYVLLKRRLLMERGWPASALLITVVRDENNEGHAILTVRTAEGDFLLDNKKREILAWSESSYTFIKRQSSADPRTWVSLAIPGGHPGMRTARSGEN